MASVASVASFTVYLMSSLDTIERSHCISLYASESALLLLLLSLRQSLLMGGVIVLGIQLVLQGCGSAKKKGASVLCTRSTLS